MKVRNAKLGAPITLIAATLALAACGDDSGGSPEAEPAASPEVAITEVEATQEGLQEALDTYSGGDQAAAADQASETYLQHFEVVEGPLEDVDAELTEELEEAIREDLVGAMESGDPVPDVRKLVEEIDADLAEATEALQGG